jgi:predicted signal transduction protein with EAL and GGDEF domain
LADPASASPTGERSRHFSSAVRPSIPILNSCLSAKEGLTLDGNGQRAQMTPEQIAAGWRALAIMVGVVVVTFVWVSAWLLASPNGSGWVFVGLLLFSTVATALAGLAYRRARPRGPSPEPGASNAKWLAPVLAAAAASGIVIAQTIGRGGQNANGLLGVAVMLMLAWFCGLMLEALRQAGSGVDPAAGEN